MATLGTLRNVVARKTGMDNTASSDEQALIDEWVNQAVTQVLLDTHCKVSKATMTLTSGTSDYDLDTDILQILRILADTTELEPVEFHEMLRLREGDSSGSVYKYTVSGSNMLMLQPTPDSAATLTLYYLKRPATLSDASHDPSNSTYGGVPSEFHKLIELWVLWQAGDFTDDASSHMGLDYKAAYQNELRQMRRYVTLKGGMRLAPVKIGGRKKAVPSSNDVYP